ncbi:hypothetical protein SADUNF_Sadunf04G0144700 [Salix dunnii]|uniref:RRM domain-containing protein n=1 Tax=Salix dunnii TaxID=1413687 RepID=A0A835KG61_9ROSI|nr:hypothetical protein SADUNF_Sadunf04G0144700 [Salix dunnii]
MPSTKGKASAAAEEAESEKPAESDEKVDYDEDYDPEEMMDEEVEYEVEEIVEEVEEEEIIEEVEVEEEENASSANGGDIQRSHQGDEAKVEDEDEKKKHAELLARPPHGSEVYIGGVPNDASENDLKDFCESVGEVAEVRMMKGKDSGDNKGFAFVTFRSVDLATKAIGELNNTEFKGKKIKCSTSQAKHRLFLSNIPRSWGEEDLSKCLAEVGPGATNVQLVKDKSSSNNRGYAFVEYYNNACAEYSRQKMMDPKFKLGENTPSVSWADPKNTDSSTSSQVKAIYVKNLPKTVTQDQLKKLFERHGKITKVVLPPAKSGQEKNRIGFVHFAERSSAMKALKDTEKYELNGQRVECALAKPQSEQKPAGGSNLQRTGLLPGYPHGAGYGMMGSSYGALGAGYVAAGFTQPLIYGSGPAPAGMTMMPMLLPDGQFGYVLIRVLKDKMKGKNEAAVSIINNEGNSQEYRYTPQLHIKEMIAGVEAGVAAKWLADQIGVDKAVMPAMVAGFVRTNCFCCMLVDFTDEESAVHNSVKLMAFSISPFAVVVTRSQVCITFVVDVVCILVLAACHNHFTSSSYKPFLLRKAWISCFSWEKMANETSTKLKVSTTSVVVGMIFHFLSQKEKEKDPTEEFSS